MGIFRQVSRPTYDDGVREQVRNAVEQAGDGGPATGPTLDELLRGKDTWTVHGTVPGEVEQTLDGETTDGPHAAAGDALVDEAEASRLE